MKGSRTGLCFKWLCVLIMGLGVSAWEVAHADPVTVTGAIFNRTGNPLPGLTVFVTSGEYKTPPGISDDSGAFQVKLEQLVENSPTYHLKIYWGDQLKYDQPLFRQPFNGQLWGTAHRVLDVGHITIGL
jgi:hypothetical protein